jgi:hypothetical protein
VAGFRFYATKQTEEIQSMRDRRDPEHKTHTCVWMKLGKRMGSRMKNMGVLLPGKDREWHEREKN